MFSSFNSAFLVPLALSFNPSTSTVIGVPGMTYVTENQILVKGMDCSKVRDVIWGYVQKGIEARALAAQASSCNPAASPSDSKVFFQFVLEPQSNATIPAFNDYFKSLNGQQVLGATVTFKKVKLVNDAFTITEGTRDPKSDDYVFASVAGEQKLTRTFDSIWKVTAVLSSDSSALANPDYSQFIAYLQDLLGKDKAMQIEKEVLPISNMIATGNQISYLLEDGTTMTQVAPGISALRDCTMQAGTRCSK